MRQVIYFKGYARVKKLRNVELKDSIRKANLFSAKKCTRKIVIWTNSEAEKLIEALINLYLYWHGRILMGKGGRLPMSSAKEAALTALVNNITIMKLTFLFKKVEGGEGEVRQKKLRMYLEAK